MRTTRHAVPISYGEDQGQASGREKKRFDDDMAEVKEVAYLLSSIVNRAHSYRYVQDKADVTFSSDLAVLASQLKPGIQLRTLLNHMMGSVQGKDGYETYYAPEASVRRAKGRVRRAKADHQQAAEALVNESNPRNIRDFGYHGETPIGKTWAMAFSVHRDSDILGESNWAVISADMERRFPEDVTIERMGHWAVGWVDYLLVRMLDDDGQLTEAGDAALDWKDKLDRYPVADENDYSERESEEAYRSSMEEINTTLNHAAGDTLPDNLPEDAAEQVYELLFSSNNQDFQRMEEDPRNNSIGDTAILEAALELFGSYEEELPVEPLSTEQEMERGTYHSTDPKQTSLKLEGKVRRDHRTARR